MTAGPRTLSRAPSRPHGGVVTDEEAAVAVRTPEQRATVEAPPPRVPPPPGPRPGAGATVLGLGLIAAGGLWLLTVLGVDVPIRTLAPVALIVIGVAVVVAAVRGEQDGVVGLAVFVGVWLTIAAVLTTTVGAPLAGGVGDREVAPATAAELEEEYRLVAGTLVIDIRDVVLDEGTTSLALSTVLGQVELVVPDEVAVRVDASVVAGQIDVLDDVVDGVSIDLEDETEGWEAATRRLDVELRVGLGEVLVRTD